MDERDRQRFYPSATRGEIEAMSGSVFGRATVAAVCREYEYVPKPAHLVFAWAPFMCEECWCPRMQYHWSNYNYRCCPGCYDVIRRQLWGFLEATISQGPARGVWKFLMEEAQHRLSGPFWLDRTEGRYFVTSPTVILPAYERRRAELYQLQFSGPKGAPTQFRTPHGWGRWGRGDSGPCRN